MPVPAPTFVRQLVRLARVGEPPAAPALAERLSQWIDWTRAVALARALDARPEPSDADAPTSDDIERETEACARARATLAEAILHPAPVPARGGNSADTGDYAPFRQRYLNHQRAMLATTGRLRGRLRDLLSARSPGLARLAEVDAMMEQTLSPREHGLLASVPTLLESHFERLRPPSGDDAPPSASGAWLDVFRRDMQGVLLAELDLRFQPVEGLLAALRTR